MLLVAACRESHLLDYANERSRFMFNFGDGAVAGLLTADARPERPPRLARDHRRLLRAPGEGARRGQRRARLARDVDGRRHFLDVADPAAMKNGLDEVSLANFVAAAEGALERSGATLGRRLATSAGST